MATENLTPIADGNYSTWTCSEGADHYALVDDPPGSPDDIDTYVYAVDTNADSFIFSALGEAGAVISNVRVQTRSRRYSATEYLFDVFFRISSTDYLSGSAQGGAEEEFTDYYWDFAENPATEAPWTNDDLAAAECGLYIDASQGRVVTQIYLIVTYTTGEVAIIDKSYGAIV